MNLDKVFDPWPSPGVNDMGPMPSGVVGQLLVALDKQDAGVADLPGASRAGGREAEAGLEEVLVLVARREPRAARLGSADAAAADRPVNSGSMEGGHRHISDEQDSGEKNFFLFLRCDNLSWKCDNLSWRCDNVDSSFQVWRFRDFQFGSGVFEWG